MIFYIFFYFCRFDPHYGLLVPFVKSKNKMKKSKKYHRRKHFVILFIKISFHFFNFLDFHILWQICFLWFAEKCENRKSIFWWKQSKQFFFRLYFSILSSICTGLCKHYCISESLSFAPYIKLYQQFLHFICCAL